MWKPILESDRERVLEERGPTALRVGVGSALTVNGVGKVFDWGPRAVGIDAFAAYLASMAVPFPTVLAWLAALAEFGGLLILLRLFTRVAAVFTAITTTVAIALVYLPGGFPMRSFGTAHTVGGYIFVLIAASVALLLLGAGRRSLEHALFGCGLVPGWLADTPEVAASEVQRAESARVVRRPFPSQCPEKEPTKNGLPRRRPSSVSVLRNLHGCG